jgi:hypothetical protein
MVATAPGRTAARYTICRDPWWVPLLVLFGATRKRSYVAVDDEWVEVRFGFFWRRFPRAHVVGARTVRRGGGYDIGWHTNLLGAVMINGSLKGLVELRLGPPERFRLLFVPVRCSRLYLSLEDPGGFLRALTEGGRLSRLIALS